jgi:hypothetical protein
MKTDLRQNRQSTKREDTDRYSRWRQRYVQYQHHLDEFQHQQVEFQQQQEIWQKRRFANQMWHEDLQRIQQKQQQRKCSANKSF